MSYDSQVVISKVLHSDNYTSNVSSMYYDAFKKFAKRNLETEEIPTYLIDEDSRWFEVINMCENNRQKIILKAMVDILKANPEKYRAMNPTNGWGDYEGAVDFLQKNYEALLLSDEATVYISC